MERALRGRRIVEAEVPEDSIVLDGVPSAIVKQAVVGAQVTRVGRKGKYWWLEFDRHPWLFGHLGMAGWIRDVSPNREHEVMTRLREHGSAPWDDESGRPRFLKLLLESEDGHRIAMTDGRRLSRLRLAGSVEAGLQGLGPDVRDEPWSVDDLAVKLKGRTAPIKALLLDQKLFAGVGNWIADEVLFQAGVRPSREAGSLTSQELAVLLKKLGDILETAIAVDADSSRYPEDWLFHLRWGGGKGAGSVGGHEIVRETVGGRTTAWAPALQK